VLGLSDPGAGVSAPGEPKPAPVSEASALPVGELRGSTVATSAAPARAPSDGASAASSEASASPRAGLLASLAAGLQAALAAGDVAATQVAHEALGKLLGAAQPGDGADVLDLAREREQRRPG
jgi:hypothetical protein